MCAWLPLWMMTYPHGYHFYHLNKTELPITYNVTQITSGNNTTNGTDTLHGNSTMKFPVLCFCEKYGVCGCDDVAANSTNGTLPVKYNSTYALINGTAYALINGSLANGTTAPGGASSAGCSSGVGVGSFVLSFLCVGLGVVLLN
jgi:hypothetical protein